MKRKKENKYLIGRCENHNAIYDYKRFFRDLFLLVVCERKRIYTYDFYEVMYMRFTIAHFNKDEWFRYYNGNWGKLADELNSFSFYLSFRFDDKTLKLYNAAIRMLRKYDFRYIKNTALNKGITIFYY